MNAENYFFAQGANLSLLKYIPRSIACFWTLVKRRPRIVFASNPPTFSPLIVWFYCLLFNAKFCMDSHTSAFDRPRWLFFMPLHAFLGRRAIWEATTNEELSDRMRAKGVTSVSVSDIPFEMPTGGSYEVAEDKTTVVFICSFDVDEPVEELFIAAKDLPDAHFYVTGNPKKAPDALLAMKPDNVTLTGFLSNEDYAELLRVVDAVMVLTTYDFTMQRGGSEAITVGKPLITSDFKILHEVFSKGTIHIDNSPQSIIDSVNTMAVEKDKLQAEMVTLREERDARWDAIAEDLEKRIAEALGEK